jgi:type I restriction enzyme M protein
MSEQDHKQLGITLWGIADKLRGAMNADDFRDYMLSLYQHASRNYALSVQGFSCYTPAMLNGGKV